MEFHFYCKLHFILIRWVDSSQIDCYHLLQDFERRKCRRKMKESFIHLQPLNLATIFPKHWGNFLEKDVTLMVHLNSTHWEYCIKNNKSSFSSSKTTNH